MGLAKVNVAVSRRLTDYAGDSFIDIIIIGKSATYRALHQLDPTKRFASLAMVGLTTNETSARFQRAQQ